VSATLACISSSPYNPKGSQRCPGVFLTHHHTYTALPDFHHGQDGYFNENDEAVITDVEQDVTVLVRLFPRY
jgi:hypothetical protein